MTKPPKGNTQINVTQTVFDFIESELHNSDSNADSHNGVDKILDIPCGQGEFASFIAKKYPKAQVHGVELFSDPKEKNFNFHKMDASTFFETIKPKEFSIVTCISGIMCFDGLDRLFPQFFSALKKGGTLVITNDNFMTIRDRLNFLFFGHFKRFKLFYDKNEGNWNIVSPQGVLMHIQRSGFQFVEIKYTSIYPEDYFLVPLAMLLYPIFLLRIIFVKNSMSLKKKMKLYPFSSLLARHYVIQAVRN